ncbi:MAG: hypothetical protein PWP03_189 [Candidatus Woesearchaeota archaeon]|nr:hypothetical protein [Candidatus Woesearchaeota archaeon]MDN5327551.1 hypothetical protein [Candidatus Woesearchaeota archaeon]
MLMKYDEEKIKKAYDEFSSRYLILNSERILQHQMYEFLSYLPSDAVILDAGCGCGRDTDIFSEEGYTVYGIDFSPKMIKLAKTHYNGKFLVRDILNTKFKDEKFDGIWANASLIHLPKTKLVLALKEFSRILKPNGFLFFNVIKGDKTFKELEKKNFYDGKLPVSLFEKDEITDLVSENGFHVIKTYVETDDTHEWIDLLCRKRV